ncbi:hypothetical protein PVAP13_5NG397700 [Panicum virgatum]|uniref:Uncharacterized protein n=1 Tax=Panicum virgatum TaxID=38727 RepID=A0A8T0RWX9_PANVG|nr:hypothetical protein PVAP13_5NG397700 [Panicum virgatum]
MEEGNAHESNVEDTLVDAAEKARNVLRTTFLEKSKVQCSSAHWGTFLFVLVKNCSLE